MDFTQDYSTPVHDNTSRKSLGRRVSFASRPHVRIFETIHSSSTGSPHSSPASALSDDTCRQPDVTNENDYPRQSLGRRRSSTRYSMAESDMDLTSIFPGSEHTQDMEFTVALGQSLRPADQDQAWLALKQVTHSGNDVSEPELPSEDEMSLDDFTQQWREGVQRDGNNVSEPDLSSGDETNLDDFTQQWREGVQQDEQYEEDAVWSNVVFY
jgi:hypothetical protein